MDILFQDSFLGHHIFEGYSALVISQPGLNPSYVWQNTFLEQFQLEGISPIMIVHLSSRCVSKWSSSWGCVGSCRWLTGRAEAREVGR